MITVRELTVFDESAFLKGAKEWAPEDLTWYSFDWKPGVAFNDHLERLRKNKANIDVPPQFVPSTMLYGFVDGQIVGRISIRHRLNENLKQRGGHVGYAIAERFRKNGYATELMRAGLQYCRTELGLKEVLVTCADDNVASWKIIEKFGGTLEARVLDSNEDEMMRRYSIPL
jgi:predicted acetyltransferase